MRRIPIFGVLLAAAALSYPIPAPGGENLQDYSRLVECMRVRDRDGPRYVFEDFQSAFDPESHGWNIEYLNANPPMLRKIRQDLHGGELRWRLDSFKQRLLFVPELRREYAALHQQYCEDLVNHVLRVTRIENPFSHIQVLLKERPPLSGPGVTVYLVHSLAREYTATYSFANGGEREVRVTLSGVVDSGRIGSYTSDLYLQEDGTAEFVHRRYTIWQNGAGNPYAALIVPAEETLHIALRKFTESAIQETLREREVQSPREAADVVEEWVRVEEAIVGGVVDVIMRDFAEGSLPGIPEALAARDVAERKGMERYALLEKGIDAVRQLGHEEAIRLYSEDPHRFREMLVGR